eukprot:CAMPEP_0170619908 /NCGR_PEP_ID=MMETSP0224-20130122/27769_1 /TAXON_ID=285029 /ORGANISM="Togula jolla, Strain CCCM 725" /LENGTH=31 /DNA_ID= /DNA_START= /DNA_END= /DNA_ORIENTATION=
MVGPTFLDAEAFSAFSAVASKSHKPEWEHLL